MTTKSIKGDWQKISNKLFDLAHQARWNIPMSFRYLLQDDPDIDLTHLISHVELSIWGTSLRLPADDFIPNMILLIFSEYVRDLGETNA